MGLKLDGLQTINGDSRGLSNVLALNAQQPDLYASMKTRGSPEARCGKALLSTMLGSPGEAARSLRWHSVIRG
jgi:hypothetical protein